MPRMRRVYPPPPPMLRGSSAIARLIAVIALLVGSGAALLVSGVRPAGAQMTTTDYDTNDNGLIEISNLDQLNAMRWDLDGDGDPTAANTSSYLLAFPDRDTATSTRMGCPSGTCAGYELTADLTFPAETSSPYNPWTPIGHVGNSFITTFDGNGHTLTGLTTSGDAAGLFGSVWATSTQIGVIKNLGVIDANVTAIVITPGLAPRGGGIVAYLWAGGQVDASYVQGGSVNLVSNGVVGGLAGANLGLIRASYSTAAVRSVVPRHISEVGGLVGILHGGTIIASYAAGPVSLPTSTDTGVGGLAGRSSTPDSVITDSYCDTEATGQRACVGRQLTTLGDPPAPDHSLVTAPGKTTAELQTPTRYCDIYENWNVALEGVDGGDNPWDFGRSTDYPRLYTPAERLTAPANACDSPPPGGPRVARPPEDTPYDPAADHPEVYVNDRWDMAATCEAQTGDDGEAEGSLIRFDLGGYQGAVILHLAIWNGEFFMSYESQDIAMPPFERNGQSATVRVTTDPAQTRFLLDSVSPTTNLVLGYADCHTDDPGATEPAESATTSTAATPPAPKVYVNDRYEMTAACDVQRNADGEPESSLIRFDLGRYQGDVLLSMSLWNGEYYASYESLDIDPPAFAREGQSATVRVATDPAETRFLLDGTPNGLRMNLVLGYADCHTAG